ncbi:J domain-containing protein CG6693 [Malaya genurostris]|uniref:J domain-containing protein CG6693 n=1 Tax=Malaya genurostris TaxID=325434 RepID=UPI0026F3E6FD|nr:J domain-containing protein CG6693 [Malaya genurostris]
MPSTLELCEQFYGTKDVYKLFNVSRDAADNEIKKAYYKLSLKVHPDRVDYENKEEATEKFKILSKIHSVLSDKEKRALYDEKGVIDDEDDDSIGAKWLSIWQQFFKPISNEDISNFEKEYTGSDLERSDIKKAYMNGKGCINYMMNCVPFMSCEDEPRIIKIIKEMIASGEVPEHKIFTEEPKSKRDRRHKKYAREAIESAVLKDKLKQKQDKKSLEQQIALRQSDREHGFTSLLDKLTDKYGNDEDEEDLFSLDQHVAKKKSKVQNVPQKKQQKVKVHKTKEGRMLKKSV